MPYLGDVDANTPAEALELAKKTMPETVFVHDKKERINEKEDGVDVWLEGDGVLEQYIKDEPHFDEPYSISSSDNVMSIGFYASLEMNEKPLMDIVAIAQTDGDVTLWADKPESNQDTVLLAIIPHSILKAISQGESLRCQCRRSVPS